MVIPKEIRRTMRIREGDPLEIFTDRDGEVIFKKYSPIGELLGFASQYADTLCKTCSYPIVITDRDSVVAYAGLPKKEVADRKVSPDIEEIMESRKLFTRREGEHAKYPVDSLEKYEISCAMPIISEGDIIGAVMSILPRAAPASRRHRNQAHSDCRRVPWKTARGIKGEKLRFQQLTIDD